MGLLPCDRNGCDEIMCRYVIASKWYVCNDCVNEFKLHFNNKGETILAEEEIVRKLKEFLETPKIYNIGSGGVEMSVEEFFIDNKL